MHDSKPRWEAHRLKQWSLIIPLAFLLTWSDVGAQALNMTIDASRPGAPIQRYVYGQFTELLGNMYEKGLWAEMLSDRKFFYPVDSSPTLSPVNTKQHFNRWRPVGPDEFVVMDKTKAYVGVSAPMITLAENTPHGITQSGLAVRQGRRYSGRIALTGSSGAVVEVSLIWGDAPEQRQSIRLDSLSENYVKFPLNFTAGADTTNARLTIVGTGTGAFHIGVVSLMPADNVEGFRADMVELLKGLDSGMYRWPGGNFVSGYDWRDGIGDRDRRPARYDYAWKTVEYNDVGTDEYMTLCRLLGIDPYICVNAGFGDAQSAASWVEYANGSSQTPMGALRARNGHPEPYRVSWWGIGNEMYGEWQLGHLYIDQYVIKHNLFAQAMRAVDPNIKLVASGATPFETSTTARHHRKPLPATLPYQFGSKQDWSGNLLENCADNIDFLAEHLYPVSDSAFDVAQQAFVPVNDPLVDRVRRTPNRVKCTVEAWEEYLKRMPKLRDRNIGIAIDEWTGGARGDFSRALCAAEGLNEMIRHTDIIKMGAYTAFSSCLSINGSDSCYSATGLIFYLYRHHLGTIPIAVTGNTPQAEVKGTVGVDKPAVSSGSDTYPLDVVAALSDNRQALTFAVVNPTESIQKINVGFHAVALQNTARKWEVAVPDLQTRNVVGQEPPVKIVETSLDHAPDQLELAPLSVSLYECLVK
jgi:alpha-N-arabinofuranosidase